MARADLGPQGTGVEEQLCGSSGTALHCLSGHTRMRSLVRLAEALVVVASIALGMRPGFVYGEDSSRVGSRSGIVHQGNVLPTWTAGLLGHGGPLIGRTVSGPDSGRFLESRASAMLRLFGHSFGVLFVIPQIERHYSRE